VKARGRRAGFPRGRPSTPVTPHRPSRASHWLHWSRCQGCNFSFLALDLRGSLLALLGSSGLWVSRIPWRVLRCCRSVYTACLHRSALGFSFMLSSYRDSAPPVCRAGLDRSHRTLLKTNPDRHQLPPPFPPSYLSSPRCHFCSQSTAQLATNVVERASPPPRSVPSLRNLSSGRNMEKMETWPEEKRGCHFFLCVCVRFFATPGPRSRGLVSVAVACSHTSLRLLLNGGNHKRTPAKQPVWVHASRAMNRTAIKLAHRHTQAHGRQLSTLILGLQNLFMWWLVDGLTAEQPWYLLCIRPGWHTYSLPPSTSMQPKNAWKMSFHVVVDRSIKTSFSITGQRSREITVILLMLLFDTN